MGYDRSLTSEIKKFLLEQGADLVGVAPVSRFTECPKETHPQHYMQDATSVVSYSMKILDGVIDVWGDSETPGKSVGPYLFYGYGLLNFQMAWIGNQAAKRLLEFRGYKSLMFPPTWGISQYRFMERMVDDYPPYLSDFSHRHAAVAAGLGEFGFSGLVLVPRFGPRVRLNSIITNAPLEPDPMYSGPKLCRPEKCDYKCVRECPTEALTLDETFTVKIGDKQYTYTKSQKIRCGIAIDGLVAGSGGRTCRKLPPRSEKKLDVLDFLEAHRAASEFDRSLMAQSRGIICGDFCGKCLRGCPAHKFYAK
nr:hypothetical protein [Candidatus Njordarchaeum guaymaensis]